MADNIYKQFVDDAEKELKRLEKEEKRIAAEKAKYEKANGDKRKKQYLEFKKQLKEIKSEQDKINEALKLQKTELKEIDKYNKSLAKLSSTVKRELGLSVDKGSLFESISQDIVKAKAEELVLEGEAKSKAARRETIMSSILGDMESQAKAVERALGGESEREKFEQARNEILSNADDLSEREIQKLRDAVDYTEDLYKKEQRILQLKQTQSNLNKELPESLQNALSFSNGLVDSFKKGGFGLGVLVGLGAALVSALSKFKALDEAADKFNDSTKLAISQMGGLQERAKSVGDEFGNIGASASDFYDVVEATLGVFGDTVRLSKEVTDSILVLNKNFGTTNKEAAEALQIVESIGGVTSETAANLLLQSTELARAADVAPAQVIKDISDAAELSYKFFRGNVDELFKQATNARRFGTNLKDVLDTTKKLLDFESSISSELKASTFVGGQFNLTQARSLAAAGKTVEAQQEILNQIQRSGDFRNKDLYTQEALAEAAGMEVSEINRLLNVREKLNSLSGEQREAAEKAIEQGLDISEIDSNRLSEQVKIFQKQKEQQGQLANISNQFNQIAATLGSAFLPLIEAVTPMIEVIGNVFGFVAKTFKSINESLATAVPFYAAIAVYSQRAFIFGSKKAKVEALVLARKKISNALDLIGLGTDKKRQRASVATALANAAKAAFANPLAALGSLAILGGLTAAVYSATKVKPTGDAFIDPNGGPILTSPQEGTLFQGSKNDAGILAPPSALGGGGTDKLARSIERLEKAYMKGIKLNIDGRNVTSRLSNVVDSSTRNNFNLA